MSWQATSRIFGHIAFCGMTICGLGCQPDATTTGQRTSSVHSSAAETKTSPVHHSGKPVWQKHADTEKYVGTQACAACHAGISQTYETHPMSHSLFLAKDLPLVSENTSDSFDPPGPCRYLISRDEHGLSQTEEFLDQSGEVVYRDTVPVQYAVGSGQRGWSFQIGRAHV